MECKKCGNTLRSGENFCTICGYYNDREEAKKEEKKKLDVDFDDDDDDDFFSDPNKESKEEVVETEEFFPEENIEYRHAQRQDKNCPWNDGFYPRFILF